jgi:GNAT superfamily N-acetyltransferase
MTELTVSVVQRDDLAALVESVSGLFHDDAGQHDPCMDLSWPAREGLASYGKQVDDPAVLLLLAREGERVVGHLVGKVRGPSSIRRCRFAILESIRVVPDARGRGVGTRLVERFFGWARDNSAEQALVTAYAANQAAQRFYARYGFVPFEATMCAPVP